MGSFHLLFGFSGAYQSRQVLASYPGLAGDLDQRPNSRF